MYEFRQFHSGDLFEVMSIVNKEMSYEYSPDAYLNTHRAWPEGFIVVTYYQKIVGFMMSGITPQHALRILLLVIKNEFKSLGLGKALMDRMAQKAKVMGINRMILEVRVTNAGAIAFYQRLGLNITGRVKGFYKDGMDAFIMQKILSS